MVLWLQFLGVMCSVVLVHKSDGIAGADVYRKSLVKSLTRSLEDGSFGLVILDAPNHKADHVKEIWALGQRTGYEVFVMQPLTMDAQVCWMRQQMIFSGLHSGSEQLSINSQPMHDELHMCKAHQAWDGSIFVVCKGLVVCPNSENFTALSLVCRSVSNRILTAAVCKTSQI